MPINIYAQPTYVGLGGIKKFVLLYIVEIQVLAIEFVTLAIEFVALAIEFVTLAIKFTVALA